MLMLLVLLLLVFFCCYFYVKHKYAYWKNQGIPFIEPEFPFGNIKTLSRTESLTDITTRIYNETKHKHSFAGIYTLLRPAIVVTGLEFLKTICIKDFKYFMDRGLYSNEKDDPISATLPLLEGDRWTQARAKLTPTFTSGKIKMMFPTVVSTTTRMLDYINDQLNTTNELDIKEISAKFTTDVIGNIAFGVECNSFIEPNGTFQVMGKKVFEKPRNTGLLEILTVFWPNLCRKLKIKRHHDDLSEFFMKLVADTVSYRETNSIKRNDFMDLLIQLKNNGQVEDDNSDKVTLTLNEISAHSLVFFGAGFETSSSSMALTLYELALNLKVQTKARLEIEDILKKYNGELVFEALTEFKYLDQIINESFRKYPTLPTISRIATKAYRENETGAIFQKGTHVYIPIYAIHHDPELYPNPEIFDPERFSEESKSIRNPMAYLPFGVGPRNCIAYRFGLMEAKVGLIVLLSNYEFSRSPKTVCPLEFDKKTMALLTKDKSILVNIKKV